MRYSSVRAWLVRLLDRFRRERLDRELAEELRFHEQQLALDALAEGADPTTARHLARRRLGDGLRVREEARALWSIPWLDHLGQDLRYTFRRARRAPGFTAAVTLTLALGIGANASMFAVVDRLMFRPVERLRDGDHVHRVYLTWTSSREEVVESSMSYGRYRDLQTMTRSFSDFALFAGQSVAVGLGESAREQPLFAVSASFFDFFDAPPALGRYFDIEEDVPPDGSAVVVLSHAYWKTQLAKRTDVLGQILHVGDIAATIIGVAPADLTFAGLNDMRAPALFVPIATLAAVRGTAGRAFYGYAPYPLGSVLVRRLPGVTVEAAAADVSRFHRMSWDAERTVRLGTGGGGAAVSYSVEDARPQGAVAPVRRAAGPNPIRETRIGLWLSGVALLVLLIAFSNLANLFIVRELNRMRETTLRLALGVTRGRLIRQALVEGCVLTLSGAVLGLVLAQWGAPAVEALLMPMPAMRGGSPSVLMDARTVTLALVLAVVPGLVVAVAPVLLSGRRDLTSVLKTGGRGVISSRTRLRSGLLLTQTALSVLLLVGALLFGRSLGRLEAMPLGYHPDRVLVATPVFRATPLDESGRAAVFRTLLAEAQRIPGVEAAAWSRTGPILGTIQAPLFVPGIDSVGALGSFAQNGVSPDYFQVLDTRIVRGRGISALEAANAPRVALVSERMAMALWPDQEAIGQCLRVGADTVPCSTVVGVVEDIVTNMWSRLDGTPQPFYYYLAVEQSHQGDGRILLRVSGDPALHLERVRIALQRLLPGASYMTVEPMRQTLDIYYRPWQLGARMFGAFGGLALIVAALGLYGVISYNIAQRMHELGVRLALGARRLHIIRLVIGPGTSLALGGVSAGLALALFAARWIQPLLFNQSASDPRVFGIVSAVMVGIALVASALPTLRALRADPNRLLRSD